MYVSFNINFYRVALNFIWQFNLDKLEKKLKQTIFS